MMKLKWIATQITATDDKWYPLFVRGWNPHEGRMFAWLLPADAVTSDEYDYRGAEISIEAAEIMGAAL